MPCYPCYPSLSLTMCPRWDESGQTPSNIRLHRLDGDRLPVTIGDLQDDDHPHPLFLPLTVAEGDTYCYVDTQDCFEAYRNIRGIMEVIGNIVRPLINNYISHPVSFSEYDTLSFIVLDQSIDLSILHLEYADRIYSLHNNALYLRLAQTVIFGQYFIDTISYSAAIQLEIVAHEFCHMLISKILNPNSFYPKRESGALEESFCDIFAVLISRRINGTWNWEIGQNMGDESGQALRNFCDPESSSPLQPSHYSNIHRNGDVHINCGIHNRAFCRIINSPYFDVDFLIKLLIKTISTDQFLDICPSIIC